jgi:hypothetical protein
VDEALKVAGVLLTVLGVPMLMIYVVAPVLQSLGRRWAGTPASGEGESELEALRAEVEALRELHPRMAELEERVDFAERLLARRDEMAPLPPTRD